MIQEIKVPVGLETRDAIRDANDMRNALRNAFNSSYMKGQSDEFARWGTNAKSLYRQLRQMLDDLERFRNVQMPTEEFTQLTNTLGNAERELDRLISADERLQQQISKNKTVAQYRQALETVQELRTQIETLSQGRSQSLLPREANVQLQELEGQLQSAQMIVDKLESKAQSILKPLEQSSTRISEQRAEVQSLTTQVNELANSSRGFTIGDQEGIAQTEQRISNIVDKANLSIRAFDGMVEKQQQLNTSLTQSAATESEVAVQTATELRQVQDAMIQLASGNSQIIQQVRELQSVERELYSMHVTDMESLQQMFELEERQAQLTQNLANSMNSMSDTTAIQEFVALQEREVELATQLNTQMTDGRISQEMLNIKMNAGDINQEVGENLSKLRETEQRLAEIADRMKLLEAAGRGIGYAEYDSLYREQLQLQEKQQELVSGIDEYRKKQREIALGTEEVVQETTSWRDVLGAVKDVWGSMKGVIQQVGVAVKNITGLFQKIGSHVRNALSNLVSFNNESQKSHKPWTATALTIAKALIGVRGLFMLVRKLRSAIVAGFQNLAKESIQAQMQLQLLQAKFLQLKNSAGASIASLVAIVTPAITKIIDLFTRAFNIVAMFFGALSGKGSVQIAKTLDASYGTDSSGSGSGSKGKTPQEKYDEAVKKANEKYEKALAKYNEKVAKAEQKQADAAAKLAENQEKANHQLQGFDELNNLTLDSMDDTDDAMKDYFADIGDPPELEMPNMEDFLDGGSGGGAIQDMFEEAEVPDWISDFADKIKQMFLNLIEPIKKAWADMADFVKKSWAYAIKEIGKLLSDVWRDFIAVWKSDTMVSVFKDIFKIVGDIGLIIGNIAKKLREAWNYNQNGLKLLTAIRDIIKVITGYLADAFDSLVKWTNELSFIPLFTAITRYVQSLVQVVDALMGVMYDFLVMVLEPLAKWTLEAGLPELVNILTRLNDNIDWELLRERFAKLWEHLEPFAERVGEGLLIFIDTLAQKLADWVNSGAFEEFLDKIIAWMDSVTVEDIVNFANSIATFIAGIATAVKEFVDIITPFAKAVAEFALAHPKLVAFFAAMHLLNIGGIASSLLGFVGSLLKMIAVVNILGGMSLSSIISEFLGGSSVISAAANAGTSVALAFVQAFGLAIGVGGLTKFVMEGLADVSDDQDFKDTTEAMWGDGLFAGLGKAHSGVFKGLGQGIKNMLAQNEFKGIADNPITSFYEAYGTVGARQEAMNDMWNQIADGLAYTSGQFDDLSDKLQLTKDDINSFNQEAYETVSVLDDLGNETSLGDWINDQLLKSQEFAKTFGQLDNNGNFQLAAGDALVLKNTLDAINTGHYATVDVLQSELDQYNMLGGVSKDVNDYLIDAYTRRNSETERHVEILGDEGKVIGELSLEERNLLRDVQDESVYTGQRVLEPIKALPEEIEKSTNAITEDVTKMYRDMANAGELGGMDIAIGDKITQATAQAEAQMKAIKTQLETFSEGGNVDLVMRPVIDADELNKQGYDAGKGAATVFTSTFSSEAGDVAVNFTPIIADPETGKYLGVMNPDEFNNYCWDVIDGVRKDDMYLQVGTRFVGDDAIERAEAQAEAIHVLQEQYYADEIATLEQQKEAQNQLANGTADIANSYDGLGTSLDGVSSSAEYLNQITESTNELLSALGYDTEGIDTINSDATEMSATFETLKGHFAEIESLMGSGLADSTSGIADATQKIADTEDGVLGVNRAFDGMSESTTNAQTNLSTIASSVDDISNSVETSATAFESFNESLETTTESINTWADELGITLSEKFTLLAETVLTTFSEALNTKLEEIQTTVSESFTQMFNVEEISANMTETFALMADSMIMSILEQLNMFYLTHLEEFRLLIQTFLNDMTLALQEYWLIKQLEWDLIGQQMIITMQNAIILQQPNIILTLQEMCNQMLMTVQVGLAPELFAAIVTELLNGMLNAFAEGFPPVIELVVEACGEIAGAFEGIAAAAGGAVSAVKMALSELASLDFGGLDFGGASFNIGGISLPGLATGTVIPPNMQQFMAVLGDNNQETEVVSPLSTMKEAMIEALQTTGFSGGSSDNSDIVINVDGYELFRVVRNENSKFKTSTGISAFV